MRRPSRALLPLVAVLALASGCGGLGGTGDSGIVTGDGTITVLDVAQRKTPEKLPDGIKTLDGQDVALADYRGQVLVINVWGSWCGPCRSEADDLAVAAKELMPKGVAFLGINTRDNSRDTALAFVRRHGMPYPSIFDPGGSTLTAFHRTLSPNAIPSTVVIDAQGRVAASIIGEITSPRTLVDIVDEVQGTAS